MSHRTWEDYVQTLGEEPVDLEVEIYPPNLPHSDRGRFSEGYCDGFECHISLELRELQDSVFIEGFLQGLRESMEHRRVHLEDKLYGGSSFADEPDESKHLQFSEF